MKTSPSPDSSRSNGIRLRNARVNTRRFPTVSISAVLALTVLTGCTPQSGDAALPTSAATSPAAQVVATDLDAPWSVVPVDESLLVSERDTGRIIEVLPDGTTASPGR